MPRTPAPRSTQRHISVVAVANSTASTLFGIYDVLAYVENRSLATTGSAPLRPSCPTPTTCPSASVTSTRPAATAAPIALSFHQVRTCPSADAAPSSGV